ncbi:hypothetical protein GCM10009719_09720 [Nocardioides kribbensis]
MRPEEQPVTDAPAWHTAVVSRPGPGVPQSPQSVPQPAAPSATAGSAAGPRTPGSARRRLLATGALVVVAAGLGFAVGRDARVVEEDVSCLSAQGTISCELEDGWTVSVPRDVAWTDRRGAFHQGGRPTCLPPTGIGLEGPVRVWWVAVDEQGVGQRQVVRVAC